MRTLLEKMPPEMRNYTSVLYSSLFELSRSYQSRQMEQYTDLSHKIADAIAGTPSLFPRTPPWASAASRALTPRSPRKSCSKCPLFSIFNNFEGVFTAIEKGLCQYGVVPIENSTAGSVKKVYDLMIHHNFSIVRSVRLKIDHNLLAKRGTKLENIKEIYSTSRPSASAPSF